MQSWTRILPEWRIFAWKKKEKKLCGNRRCRNTTLFLCVISIAILPWIICVYLYARICDWINLPRGLIAELSHATLTRYYVPHPCCTTVPLILNPWKHRDTFTDPPYIHLLYAIKLKSPKEYEHSMDVEGYDKELLNRLRRSHQEEYRFFNYRMKIKPREE